MRSRSGTPGQRPILLALVFCLFSVAAFAVALRIADASRRVVLSGGMYTATSDCQLRAEASGTFPYTLTFTVIDAATREPVTNGIWVTVRLEHSANGSYGTTRMQALAAPQHFTFFARNEPAGNRLRAVVSGDGQFQEFSCSWTYPLPEAMPRK